MSADDGWTAPLTEQPDQETRPEPEFWHEPDRHAVEPPWAAEEVASTWGQSEPGKETPFVSVELPDVHDTEAVDATAWLEGGNSQFLGERGQEPDEDKQINPIEHWAYQIDTPFRPLHEIPEVASEGHSLTALMHKELDRLTPSDLDTSAWATPSTGLTQREWLDEADKAETEDLHRPRETGFTDEEQDAVVATGASRPQRTRIGTPMRSPFAADAFPSTQLTEYEITPRDDHPCRIDNTLAVPFRWVCSLDVNGAPTVASGVLIGPRQVLTAAHVIYKRGKWPDSLYVAPARNRSCKPFGQFKAIAYATTSRYLTSTCPGGPFDLAMITLDRDVSETKTKGHGGVRLGYWGEAHQTDLRPLKPGLLTGQWVTACGYPSDKCDGQPIDRIMGCSQDRLGNTMWAHSGMASFMCAGPGLIYYTAETAGGQSGGPVWIKRTDGRRSLVGVNVGRENVGVQTPGKPPPFISFGVHLNEENLAWVRSWLLATTVRRPR